MNIFGKVILALGLFTIITAYFSFGIEQTSLTEALVVRVIDGDTIELENGERVRYIGINTPETVHPEKPVECFGKAAKERNIELVLNETVRLERDVSDRDQYGRLLRYVYIDDVFVNKALVEEGYAYAYTLPPDVRHADTFVTAEASAREHDRGLWSACAGATESEEDGRTCAIKGNISASGEKIYHIPGCDYYTETVIDIGKGEQWFCTEFDAEKAGWRKAQNCPQ
jgi:micrococcal nuclease